ncbi:two pore domain potassium channel family protein [Flagellimonas sp. CMM7]|uniref:two pore domain potassium channel family protein n=1 Tax=Flagellimonas sp. CMM7 TaxID=2654676 RepID=UPI0013D18FBC|nr:two pore domain potassium channel family protein [Flagellimonas sp. CMM7]UII80989.1 potassium channel family protein [Flagellimonas sp. CMM7]
MTNRLYKYRFEIFFFSQITILFGSLIFPPVFFETILAPLLFVINLAAGIILISKRKKLMWFFTVLLAVTLFAFGSTLQEKHETKVYDYLQMAAFFLFYIAVTIEIITQVWSIKKVNKNVILGLISGYISLGLLGFFICLSIEMTYPESFQGLFLIETGPEQLTERLLYYSFITLLTIGYGDILPITSLAQKAAILIGLMGQFYLVIITAAVVGKYINQFKK